MSGMMAGIIVWCSWRQIIKIVSLGETVLQCSLGGVQSKCGTCTLPPDTSASGGIK